MNLIRKIFLLYIDNISYALLESAIRPDFQQGVTNLTPDLTPIDQSA